MTRFEFYELMNQNESLAFHFSSIVLATASLVGGFYILFHTMKKIMKSDSMTLYELFPALLSICDVLFNVFQIGEHFMSLGNSVSVFETTCKVVLFFLTFLMVLECSLILILSYSSWTSISLKKLNTYGKYAWMVLVPCTVEALLVVFLAIVLGIYDQKNNCNAFTNKELHALIIGHNGTLLVIIAYFTIKTAILVKVSGGDTSFSIVAISTYLPRFSMGYLVRKIPIYLVSILSLAGVKIPFVIIIFTIPLANIGGIINGVIYQQAQKELIERRKSSRDSEIYSSYSTPFSQVYV